MNIDVTKFSEEIHKLSLQVMEDGVLDFDRDRETLEKIISQLFDRAVETLLDVMPGVTGRSLTELIVHQMLALEDHYKWDMPGVGEAREDQLLVWFTQRRARVLIKERLGGQVRMDIPAVELEGDAS
uniref:Uncharacterized protein n=1 Tax=viral metagenome TaxID=1070528 RepID=A0A6M3IML0_9ZZZZ